MNIHRIEIQILLLHGDNGDDLVFTPPHIHLGNLAFFRAEKKIVNKQKNWN